MLRDTRFNLIIDSVSFITNTQSINRKHTFHFVQLFYTALTHTVEFNRRIGNLTQQRDAGYY